MTKMNSRPQRFLFVAITCLAASTLVPVPASAGGRGSAAQPYLSADTGQTQSRLSALDRRVAALERKAAQELASSDEWVSAAAAPKRIDRRTGQSAAGRAADRSGQ